LPVQVADRAGGVCSSRGYFHIPASYNSAPGPTEANDGVKDWRAAISSQSRHGFIPWGDASCRRGAPV